MCMLKSGKEKMLMQGDFNMTSMQRYMDSLEEVIRQTILEQDVIFRNQVYELHRLYRVQKSLMEDLRFKEFDMYNSLNANAQSSQRQFTKPATYESLVKEAVFPLKAKVGSTSFVSQELLEGCEGTYYKHQHTTLDLQLSADKFINNVEEDLPKKGGVWNHIKEPINSKHPLCGVIFSGLEELKFSLGIGEDCRRMGSKKGTSFDDKTHSCCYNVIDLEESVERTSDGYGKSTASLGCATTESCSKVKHVSQVSIFPDSSIPTSRKKEPPSEIAAKISLHQYSECSQGLTSNEESRKFQSDVPCRGLSSKMQKLTSHQGALFDLNEVHIDDSSCYSNDTILAYPSTASSDGGSGGLICSSQEGTYPATFGKKEDNMSSNKTSDMLQHYTSVDSALQDFNSKNQSEEIFPRKSDGSGRIMSFIDTESMPICQVDISEILDINNDDLKDDNVELKSKGANIPLNDSDHPSIATGEVSCEKSEVEDAVFSCTDQNQNTFQDGYSNQSPASCKSCISDNDSSSVKRRNSSNVSRVLNLYSETLLESQVVNALSGEQNPSTPETSNSKKESKKKKEESVEMDVLIQKAAELLIRISLDKSTDCSDSYTTVGVKEMENEEREKPHCSSDSYELIAMNVTEGDVDDNAVTSQPFEVNDLETKEFGFKLRRGRRLKDFQKEILPGIATLSRHEIQEDIYIMEGVLRSREYRKMREKMAGHDELSTLVRSRWPRGNRGRRRKFS